MITRTNKTGVSCGIILAVLLTMTLMFGVAVFFASETASADGDTPYIKIDGTGGGRDGVTELDQGSMPSSLDDTGPEQGWFLIASNITISSLTINGDVHIIIKNGVTLTISKGGSVTVTAGSDLSVYRQPGDAGGAAGRLVSVNRNCVILGGGSSLTNTAYIGTTSDGACGVSASGEAAVVNGTTGTIMGLRNGVMLSAGGTVTNYGIIESTTENGV